MSNWTKIGQSMLAKQKDKRKANKRPISEWKASVVKGASK